MGKYVKFLPFLFFIILSCFFPFFSTSLFAYEQNYSPEEVLVKFRPMVKTEERLKFHREFNTTLVGNIKALNLDILRVQTNLVDKTIERLRYDPRIIYAEPNYKAYALELVNDPGITNNLQWGMYKVKAADVGESAWTLTRGDGAIKIAILDTGIDQNHEDLSGKIVGNKNCTNSKTVDDRYGHGTHVAGIAAASTNNGVGIAGLGYNTALINAKALGDDGSGYYSWIAQCIIWAADNGANVINMSLGGSSQSKTLEDAVKYAWDKGVVLVAAAGNSNSSQVYYPAAYANVLSVAATDQGDSKASFSNYGTWVDVAAPGVAIYSTLPNHSNSMKAFNYGYLSGTSMATPHVAGLAALIFSLNETNNWGIIQAIEENADKIAGTGSLWQYGRINAYRSFSSFIPPVVVPTATIPAFSPTPTSTPTPTVTPTPSPTPAPTVIPVSNNILIPPIPPKPPIIRIKKCFFLSC